MKDEGLDREEEEEEEEDDVTSLKCKETEVIVWESLTKCI